MSAESSWGHRPTGGGSRRRGALALLLLLVLLPAAPAGAFEFFDGRLQVHGFYEMQMRSINQNFKRRTDEWDLTQFAHVLNVEVELDVAPDGWGPFDFISAFARFEARYDCVWTRGCSTMRSADVYGNRANKQPERLLNGQRSGFTLNSFNYNTRSYRGTTLPTEFALPFDSRPVGSRRVYPIDRTPAFFSLFIAPGEDQVFGTPDDPGPFVFSRYFDFGSRCRFSTRNLPGTVNEVALTLQNLGPHDPRCFVEPIAAAGDKPNPFRGEVNYYNERFAPSRAARDNGFSGGDYNPITDNVGTGDLPFRQAPQLPNDIADRARANGLWMPAPPIARLTREGDLDRFDGNFRQEELAWNRGQSQQDEKEVKEAYVDVELFDSRLWIRAGKQSIVWGKTELFRNQDQFNPQDFALSSLPSLEESRISLWSVRAVYSFYDVGPFEDVRLEVAANFDQFESGDFGRCGEPYSVILVCSAYFGFLAHGITGLGLAGVKTPDDPWDDPEGIEVGGRLEWRWDRFSFAVSNFWGYQDFPAVERLFQFRRNVDPFSGIPRRFGATGPCSTPAFERNPAYDSTPGVGSTPTNRFYQPRSSGVDPDCLTVENALVEHHANQTVFAHSCASLIGLVEQAPEECGNQVFNSQEDFIPAFRISTLIANEYAGNPQAAFIATQAPGAPSFLPFVELNEDPCDGLLSDCLTPGPGPSLLYAPFGPTINSSLTTEQQALLGCGEFFGTDCERDGLDLFNSEASVIAQSFIGIEGNFGDVSTLTDTIQPGTVGYQGGPVATRFVNGRTVILPGARGSNEAPAHGSVPILDLADDPGYDPGVDGCSGPISSGSPAGCNAGESVTRKDGSLTPPRASDAEALQHPFAGAGPDRELGTADDEPDNYQYFRSEMAALSWNAMIVLAGLSLPPSDPDNPLGVARAARVDEIVGDAPAVGQSEDLFRNDGCSYARPQFCKNFINFARSLRVQRNTRNAGGNVRFGRRDFQWHEGAPIALDFEKTNTLGFSMDFAEDWSKSNWSAEITWVNDLPFIDNDKPDGQTDVDTFNLTISVDRPTFVNFLNANRTFFVNSQFFFQYIDGFRKSFPSNGPWNVLGTLTIATGYFQDRLLPTATFVYDRRSRSGAFLPQISYRFTENFSATFGIAGFFGRVERKTMALAPAASGNRVTPSSYFDYVENGLSVVRNRDEFFLRVKYTF